MNKLFKRWKNDFSHYWDKTNLISRIAIGAALSLIIAVNLSKRMSKPLSKEVAKLKQTLAKETAAGGGENIEDLQAQEKKFGGSAAIWLQKARDAKADRLMDPYQIADILNQIRHFITMNDLKLQSETLLPEDPEKPPPPGGIKRKTYRYQLSGPYPKVSAFLREVQVMDAFFKLQRLSIQRIPDQNAASEEEQDLLDMNFQLDLYFQPAGDAS